MTLNDKRPQEPQFQSIDEQIEYITETEEKRKILWEQNESDPNQNPSKRMRRSSSQDKNKIIPTEKCQDSDVKITLKNRKRKQEQRDSEVEEDEVMSESTSNVKHKAVVHEGDHLSTPGRQSRFKRSLEFFRNPESRHEASLKQPKTNSHR